MQVSVIIPTHNPCPDYLRRTLAALRAQTLPAAQWEAILVDNASSPALHRETLPATAPESLRVIAEPQPGLNHARRAGLQAATSAIIVFADDDNVLAPDYLEQTVRLVAAHPRVGAFGGRSAPEFETPPAAWVPEFFDLLALRDLGPTPIIAPAQTPRRAYPSCAPIGAGMVLRREAAALCLATPDRGLTDRRGSELTSGGDNDIVLTVFGAGWDIAYFPELVLTHLIPAARLQADYLARLNRGIQKSWMQVLSLHDANPWPALSTPGAVLRQVRAWFTYRAWASPAAHIRWQGACGHFEGRSTLNP